MVVCCCVNCFGWFAVLIVVLYGSLGFVRCGCCFRCLLCLCLIVSVVLLFSVHLFY